MADYKKGDTASWDAEQVRRSESEQRPRQVTRKKRRKRRGLHPLLKIIMYIPCVLIISGLLASAGWTLMSDLCAFNKEPVTATIQVTVDDNVSSVADKLEEAGLIESAKDFDTHLCRYGYDKKISVGTYKIPVTATHEEMAKILTKMD